MDKKQLPQSRSSYYPAVMLPFMLLLTGTVLLMFSNGRGCVPVAAWLFPVFFIRFFRTQRGPLKMVSAMGAFVAAHVFMMWQILSSAPLPPLFRIASGIASGLIFLIPFIADRIMAPRLRGVAATLVFPFAWVALEYFRTTINGSWFSLAYTQYGNLPLMQVVSVTGIWGISFLITWFASVVNFFWKNGCDWFKTRRIIALYLSILFAVLFYGGARLSLSPPDTETIKVASIVNPSKNFITLFFDHNQKERESFRKQSIKEQDYFLKSSHGAALNGARIVVWQEYAVALLEEDEASFIARACELARNSSIYLGMAYATLPRDFPSQPWKNKLVWIAPEGKKIAEYNKSKPAPPLEPILPGKGVIPVIATPFGNIASVICTDQDYPGLVRQAGEKKAGLLLIASLNWKSVSPLHSHMGVFRAIENGCSMVKATGEGLSIAVDYQGRTLTSLDYWNTKAKMMVSNVPVKRTATLYSQWGDILARLCTIGFLVLAGLSWRNRRV
jgi:apolipoprotein N-acyltransferase